MHLTGICVKRETVEPQAKRPEFAERAIPEEAEFAEAAKKRAQSDTIMMIPLALTNKGSQE